jgi:hypothetical protein
MAMVEMEIKGKGPHGVVKDFLKLKIQHQMKKNNALKLLYVVTAISLIALTGYRRISSDRSIVHFYFTPRNVNYGWADLGLFKFSLNRKSVKVEYSQRSFITNINADSLYELFYDKEVGTTQLLNWIKLSHRKEVTEQFLFPRILIIINNSLKSDSLLVDKNYTTFYKGKTYEINNKFKDYIIKKMPLEIKDNWVYDKPGR